MLFVDMEAQASPCPQQAPFTALQAVLRVCSIRCEYRAISLDAHLFAAE